MVFIKTGRFDSDVGAGRAVAVVFGEMDDAVVFGDLHVDRRAQLEAMFPIDLETEESR